MRLWELALRGSRALRLRQAALPSMERIQARVREHTQLAVLEHDTALFLERLSHPDAGANITRIAGRLPLHASSSGLVLLAYAEPDAAGARAVGAARSALRGDGDGCRGPPPHPRGIRRSGFVVSPGSVEAVSTGVAVPVRDETGEVVAALSVVLPRETPPEVAITELLRAARDIRAALAGDREHPGTLSPRGVADASRPATAGKAAAGCRSRSSRESPRPRRSTDDATGAHTGPSIPIHRRRRRP